MKLFIMINMGLVILFAILNWLLLKRDKDTEFDVAFRYITSAIAVICSILLITVLISSINPTRYDFVTTDGKSFTNGRCYTYALFDSVVVCETSDGVVYENIKDYHKVEE